MDFLVAGEVLFCHLRLRPRLAPAPIAEPPIGDPVVATPPKQFPFIHPPKYPMNKCSPSQCDCHPGIARRDFLQLAALAAVGTALPGMQTMAGPFDKADFEKLVPSDKKLDPAWIKSLFARGEPTVYRHEELDSIGMPVGGICTGQLYLGGDGRLLLWDIFNAPVLSGFNEYRGPNYAKPRKPAVPIEQGFQASVFAGNIPSAPSITMTRRARWM